MIELIREYCVGEIENTTKFIKSKDTVNPVDYYYGERNAFMVILEIIEDHSSPTTTIEEAKE